VNVVIPSPARTQAFSWRKWLIVAGSFLYLFFCAIELTQVRDPLQGTHAVIPVAIALMPLCVFLTFRYPLIFPFGLYVLIAPVDALLAVSGAASLLKLIGAGAAGALILRTILLRRALAPHRAWYLWLAFLAYATLSIAWAPDFFTGIGTTEYVPMILLFIMMTVLAIYPAEPREFKVMLATVVAAGVCAAAYTLAQYHPGSTLDASRIALKGIDTATVEDPNYLGGAFLLPFAVALAAVFFARTLIVRIVAAAALLPMVAAVLATGSRSAFLGLCIIVAYFIIRSKYRIQALLVAGGGFLLTLSFPTVMARFMSKDTGSADGRTDIWRTGMHTLGDHWLFGAGFGSYQYEYDRSVLKVFQETFAGWTRPGHSLIFVSLNDFGVIGLVLVLACWFVGFRSLRVIPKDHWLYGARFALEAALLGLFVHMLFLDPIFVKYVWLAQSLPLLVLNLYAPNARGAIRATPRVPKPRWGASIRGV
jgi:hypothetical protein